jgi:hypothetical protein
VFISILREILHIFKSNNSRHDCRSKAIKGALAANIKIKQLALCMFLRRIFVHLVIWVREVVKVDRSDLPAPLFPLRCDFPGSTMEWWIELAGIDGLWVHVEVVGSLELVERVITARGTFTTILIREG